MRSLQRKKGVPVNDTDLWLMGMMGGESDKLFTILQSKEAASKRQACTHDGW